MRKANGKALTPVSMEVYRQLVFDVAAHLSDGSWNQEQAMNYLFDLAERPVQNDPHKETDKEPKEPLTCIACKNCGFTSFAENKSGLACGVGEKHFSLDEDHTAECPAFRSRYIQYPIQVNEIDSGGDWTRYLRANAQLAEVRLAGETRTHLGFFLGDIPMSAAVSYNHEGKTLKVLPFANPAIFVPELGKIVFGCESWWRRIDRVEDAANITDQDIENTWYMRMLREMNRKDEEK